MGDTSFRLPDGSEPQMKIGDKAMELLANTENRDSKLIAQTLDN